VIRTALGDIHLDLSDGSLPAGDTELTLLCWVGTVQVRVPEDLTLDVTAQTFVGSVDVLGVREEGLIRDIHVRSADRDAERHLRLRLSTVIGELVVVQPGGRTGLRVDA
jgi:lia operon protein LiaF